MPYPLRLRAPRSLALRALRRRLRLLSRRPFVGWLAREPEIVVRVPRLDSELLAAIRLVAPHYTGLVADEASRRLWELDQNRSCWVEDAVLAPLLRDLPPPRRILEIGAGLGRSAVFFSRRHFPAARFDLFDATGHEEKYELAGRRHADSFCGNLEALRRCLAFNRVENFDILDGDLSGGQIPIPPEPYDLIYSFYAVGFHWSVDHWLDEILAVAHQRTLCAVIVPSHYEPSARIAALPHLLLEASPLLLPAPLATVYFLVFTPGAAVW